MKAVTLYRPRTFENALTGLDRVMESFFGSSLLGESLLADSFLNPSERIFNKLPAVDVRETEKSYILEADLPGLDEKSIDIHLDGNTLTIKSKKEEEKKEEKDAYMIKERRQFFFSRSFTLPEDADRESVSANFKNGVLSVQIGKSAETRKRVIEITKN